MTVDNKIVLYGEYGVGKSCITTRLLTKKYEQFPSSTIGASFMFWRPKQLAEDRRPSFGIWDTAGQERFSGLLPMYLRGADVIIYCWDYNVPFDTITADKKYSDAIRYSPHCHFYLVMTKIDLSDDKEIKSNIAEKWIADNNIYGCYYTSSYTGQSIEELFMDIAKNIDDMPPQKDIEGFIIPEYTGYKDQCCS